MTYIAMYLTNRDLGHEDGEMQEQMRCLEAGQMAKRTSWMCGCIITTM